LSQAAATGMKIAIISVHTFLPDRIVTASRPSS